MSRIYQVRIHNKVHTIKWPGTLVVAMLVDSDDIASMIRSFRCKGIDADHFLCRPMDEQEKRIEESSYRIHWYTYDDWEKLIADEWAITGDRGWCEQLRAAGRVKKPLDKIIASREYFNS
ncbi:hypothetical protein V9K67_21545 [Paraflavisolibacter sp. H34]|uniref:hypothetical protein n=1 Tax=Huijunlia imazamoxiresistens TaxID=3127457 RepID=UPI003016920E